MRSPEGTSPEPRFGSADLLWLLGLTGLCAVLRLPRLRSLPIFGDEAIFLHCARLIRENPFGRLWISLQEANPPLHTWLLALTLPLSSDPLRAGRMLSVFLGVLMVPAIFLLSREMHFRFDPRNSDPAYSHRAAIFGCLLMVFSPFFALSARMARVDALFALETVLAVWLSVKLAAAVQTAHGSNPALRPLPRWSALLGLTVGMTMLTRQNFSYVLWALPVVSFLLLCAPARRSVWQFAASLFGSLSLAALLWLPMLTAKTGPDVTTRIFHLAAARQPLPFGDRMRLAVENLARTLEWLWLYLTPPVALLSVSAIIWLAVCRRWRLLGFLLSWTALLLIPVALIPTVLFPRYALPAAVPLIVAAGSGLAEIWRGIGAALRSPWRRRLPQAAILLLLLLWPARDVFLQVRSWREQTLAPIDRWQFVSGWPAGYATEKSLAYLRDLASRLRRPLVVITSPDSGNPPDTLWLYGSGDPRLTLYAAASLEEPLLVPAAGLSGAFLLRDDLRRGKPARPVRLPPDVPVLYVSRERIYTLEGYQPVEEVLRPQNPRIRAVARFENPLLSKGKPGDAIQIFALR